MNTRKHIAAEKKRCGSHNCAQAILHTYADVAGIDEDTAMNIANSFGAGMGNKEGTCGGLVGAGMVLGMVNKDKAKSMKQMREIMAKFQERNGATQCKLLKGVGTKVVREAERWAKELGFSVSVVESRENKIHFYETMGYVADYSKKIVGETFTCYRMEKRL